MSNIIALADNHNRDEDEFFGPQRKFYDWFADQSFNHPKNTLVDAGDHFHRAKPSPREYGLTFQWLKRLKFEKMFWLVGNHDTLSNGVSVSLHPLEVADSRVQIIRTPCIEDIDGYRVLFLPFEYNPSIDGVRYPRQEYYSLLADLHPEWHNADLLVHHFPDETQAFGKKHGTDLGMFEAKLRQGGDIHLQGPTYIGNPFPKRYDEAGQKGRILEIDPTTSKTSYHQVPRFVDFVTVKYGEEPVKNPEGETLLVVYDAPTKQAALDRYSAMWNVYSIRFLQVGAVKDEASKKANQRTSIKEHLLDFIKAKSIPQEVANLLTANLLSS
jgi:hypothetical protein